VAQLKQPKDYKGKQLLLLSDRLVLSARKEGFIIAGNEYISLSSNGPVNIDTPDTVTINAKGINLGIDAKEFLVKGDTLKTKLEALIDAIIKMTVSTPVGPSTPPINLPDFQKVKSELSEILSSQNKTL
jgi:hypothetical protein